MTASAADVWSTLDSLTELYKVDVTSHYENGAKERRGGNRNVQRFGYLGLAKKIFDPVAAEQLPALYIGLFDAADEYCDKKRISKIGNPKFWQTLQSLRDLILNVLIPYQLPQQSKKKVTEKDSKKKVKNVQVMPRCTFNLQQAKALFTRFLPINLSPVSKMWKQMMFILTRSLRPQEVEQLSSIAEEHVSKGNISFSSIEMIMQDHHLNRNLLPSLVLHAAYLGPLRPQTVETFASGRTIDFRKKCRESLNAVEKARKNAISHDAMRPENIPWKYGMSWTYSDFSKHVHTMMGELKGVKSNHPGINPGWAFTAVKKFGKRTYMDMTYGQEGYYDLLWTVLSQRHNMKKFVVDTLEKDYQDVEGAKYWRQMNPAQMQRHNIINPWVKEIDLLEHTDEFLNFPSTVKGISMVSTNEELNALRDRMVTEVLQTGACTVGLDAEWSAFNGDSKATILQIALRDHIYIVDIEAKDLSHDQLREFFSFMFLRKNIIKIGFQFGEDLLQLRSAVANCRALCEPERVVCVGRIVTDLLDMTEKRLDAEEILQEVCPNFLARDAANETQESVEDKENDAEEDEVPSSGCENLIELASSSTSAASQKPESRSAKVENKGLSYYCEQVLGRPLDKMEQCSVWDRRPLRPLQMRYAAMDAYCLLMLLDVCTRWAQRLEMNISDLIERQPPPRISPPLYSDEN